MTLGQLAVTVAVLAALGLLASRFGLSAIPAYILAGLLLGPNEPEFLSLIEPSEVTEFVAELGIIFLLFFLGLEFSLERLLRSGRHLLLGGSIDLLVNASLGLLVGILMFGPGFPAILVAAAVYVSSSAVTVKGLIDFRRLADDETVLILAILVFEDLVIAFVLGFASGGGGEATGTLVLVAKVLGFIVASLAASRWLARPIDRILDSLPREFFLLFTVALVVGMSAIAHELGLSEAVGALMAGVVLAETSVRTEIEERFLGFRDLFAALFFFVFGLTIDVGALGSVGLAVAAAVAVSIVGKLGGGFAAGRVGRFSRRQSLNVGAALVAHGEFTIIIAQLASTNDSIDSATKADLTAFAGLYVLASAVIGVVLMSESKRLGRILFPTRPKLTGEGGTRGAVQ
ncbi:MAG TPA: cation:proton antiporter [Gaiellaceae bacterium]|nr:cation:proton antiporter [Gaiellaceae bacterium]